jgi:hypothetical protein
MYKSVIKVKAPENISWFPDIVQEYTVGVKDCEADTIDMLSQVYTPVKTY